MSRSRLDDKKVRKDKFHQAAKKQGFRARSVFKLEEIDQKVNLFRPGARVLDLGCAPGSWLQYAGRKVGPAGRLVGIDRTLVELPTARTLAGDVFTVEVAELLSDLEHFDVVMSDMAPDTTGIRHVDQARSEALFERALELAVATLAHGGHFVGKLFQGPDFNKLLVRCRGEFGKVKVIKPDSSRTTSIEQYVVGLGFHT
jgi:23S rRNA (uridine2552-2'-O)-methyltransferase